MQLKIGGRLVVPIGAEVQKMVLYIKKAENEYEIKDFGDFQFVPLLKNKI